MSNWNYFIRKLIKPIHLFFDRLFYWLGRQLKIGTKAPVTVFAYRGYGKEDYIFLQGRVLKEKLITSSASDSDWQDFVNNIKRMWSVEIRNASLSIQVGPNQFEVTTDKEGFFILNTNLPHPINKPKDGLWKEIVVRLTSVPWKTIEFEVKTSITLPHQARMGIISDIDDTIIRTEVTSPFKFKMFYLTLSKNASKRKAISSVSGFYQALVKGNDQKQQNPIFYVSKSPWNLYDSLEEFLQINKLPLGPLLLRDYGLPYRSLPRDYKGHKHEHITRILNTYPDLGFILIGDSGEKDTDLYLKIARMYPNQIKGIYIRDVKNKRRARRIEEILQKNRDIEIALVKDYKEAAEHAFSKGWLSLETFEQY